MRPAWVIIVAGCLASGRIGFHSATAGGESAHPSGPPQENSSYVPDDVEEVLKAAAAAEKSAAAKDWAGAVRSLQSIAEGRADAVLPVSEGRVFEGAWLVAHHRVVSLGTAALAAYEQEFGALARSQLVAAARALDEERLALVAERYLPAAAGRTAALLLADLASERGDADVAMGWLERLEDLEDGCAQDLAGEAARWRAARLPRAAVALASDEAAAARVREALAVRSAPSVDDLRRPLPPRDWPTTGGDPSRGALPAALGPKFRLAWCERLHDAPPSPFSDVPEDDERGGRPSPWLPPRAVVADGVAWASDGRFLTARDLESGRLLCDPFPLVGGSEGGADGANGPDGRDGSEGWDGASDEEGRDRREPARDRWGLLEGHALTILSGGVGGLVLCAVPEAADGSDEEPADDRPRPFRPTRPRSPDRRRIAHILAVRVERAQAGGRLGLALSVAWRASGEDADSGLPEGVRLHGAPLPYRGALWVGGVRQSKASKDRFEAFLAALDPRTGRARSVTSLGAGGPVRRLRDDEVMSLSCAGAHGRVVCVTALGLAAAVDASSSRTAWSYRYDRRPPEDDAGRRLTDDAAPMRRTTFANEPPILSGGRCFFAPTDAQGVIATFDRPRRSARHLTAWTHDQKAGFVNLSLEHLAGCTDGRDGVPPTLVGVGKGYPVSGELHTCVVGMDTASGTVRWSRPLPDGGLPEPYGRACVTASEVFVSTAAGIAGFRVADGEDLLYHDLASVGADRRALLADDRPFGNLVPVPGQGLLAVNEDSIALWMATR